MTVKVTQAQPAPLQQLLHDIDQSRVENKSVFLKVQNDKQVVVVQGRFWRFIARIACYFGAENYQISKIVKILKNEIQFTEPKDFDTNRTIQIITDSENQKYSRCTVQNINEVVQQVFTDLNARAPETDQLWKDVQGVLIGLRQLDDNTKFPGPGKLARAVRYNIYSTLEELSNDISPLKSKVEYYLKQANAFLFRHNKSLVTDIVRKELQKNKKWAFQLELLLSLQAFLDKAVLILTREKDVLTSLRSYLEENSLALYITPISQLKDQVFLTLGDLDEMLPNSVDTAKKNNQEIKFKFLSQDKIANLKNHDITIDLAQKTAKENKLNIGVLTQEIQNKINALKTLHATIGAQITSIMQPPYSTLSRNATTKLKREVLALVPKWGEGIIVDKNEIVLPYDQLLKELKGLK